VLLLAVLVVLSIVALSGAFGFRDGAYRKRGIYIGLFLVVCVLALFLSGRIT
jgi:hypothetical protein